MLFIRYRDILAEFSDEGSPDRFKTAADYRKNKYKELASRPRALYTVGDTQKLVEQEKQSGKKKIGVCVSFYISLFYIKWYGKCDVVVGLL